MSSTKLVGRKAVGEAPYASSPQVSQVSPSWRDLNTKITDGSLYPYMVRLAVLAYRTQPRFRTVDYQVSPGTVSPRSHARHASSVQDRLSPQSSGSSYSHHHHQHSASFSHSGGLGSGGSTAPPSFGNLKLPKEVPKLLQARFNKIALKQDLRFSGDEDPLLRRSFLSFYALLLGPDFLRQIKENRRAEDLVMMFLSCVAKELNKSAVEPQEAKGLVDRQAAAFVRLLIDTIRDGGLSNSCQSLIKQLESYEMGLKTSSQLAFLQPTRGAAPEAPVQMPTFVLEDMTIAKDIASLLYVADSELQRDIGAAKNEATEQRAVSELKAIERDLRDYNRHVVYRKIDFDPEFEWQEWKDKELEQISQQISHYFMASKSGTVAPANGQECYFIPPDPKSYYRHLLKRCLERDFKTAGRELESNPESIPLLLSKPSITLLNEAAHLWRIPAVTRAVLLLDVAQEMFREGLFDLDNLNDAFNLARYVATEQGNKVKKEWLPNCWPYCDKVHFVTSLQSVFNTAVDRITECLGYIYENSPPKIGPYLQTLEDFVFTDAHMQGFSPIELSKKQKGRIESTIISAAETKYDSLIDDIPRDHTLDPLHIIDLGDKLIGISKRLNKRYKHLLFDSIHIAKISTQRHLTLFSADSNSMFTHMMSHMQARNEEPSFEDMIILYKKLAEIRDIYVQVSSEPFTFDIEGVFYPYVVKWAESAASLAQSWVDPAINEDQFLPMNEEAGQFYSSSVQDIFKSFRNAIDMMGDLDWRNPLHRAKIFTLLMKGISAGVCHYSSRLFSKVQEELRSGDGDELQQVKTRQDKWLALAKSAVNGKSVQIPAPYRFMKETCVKLNNIELAQTELDKIENELDSEKLSSIIVKSEPAQKRKAQTYLFTVKIVQAEGLKACDMNGLSDPYVTLVDQQTRKQIGKTRTIYEDLNPYWDEMFEIGTGGPKWLTATVWDENALSNHDLCGRAFIRLDPSAFQDFVSQDYWLDLDTQGKLMVNISMESERDDIRFHFGKAFRTLLRTEGDMIRLIVEKFSAFVKYSISLQTLKSLTGSGRFGMDTVSNWLSNTRISGPSKTANRLTSVEIEDSLNPLFDYLNENFATLAQGLTKEMRLKVMTQTWKVVLHTIESLLLPPLSDKRTSQHQLTAAEADIVFTWLSAMRDFFHHDGAGPSLEVLQSQKYQELMTIPVYYDLSTSELKQESEKLSSLSFKSLQERNYFAIPEMIKRKNTVMAHRNKKALKKQAEQIRNAKRETPQTEDIILRILRARGEIDYLSRRLKQRERIAQTLATESIVRNAAAGGFKRKDDFR
ncbi:hypothetical protein TRVA0_004S00320 [Trichomonascus vanleenenianus]|uniref:uncharacterized protein n=1 Tax=Trichomonascus vanleenenianus TaxID=2268995 RepID=UPI003EC99C28